MSIEDIYSLDIETAPIGVVGDSWYALEPYRVHTNQAEITCISAWGKDGLLFSYHYKMDDFNHLMQLGLDSLHGKEVYCTRTTFDTSFLVASGLVELREIRWRDTAILNKFLTNGQVADSKKLSYSLKAQAERYCKDHPDLKEFLDVKGQSVTAGEDFDYWLKRNVMDVDFTYCIAVFLLKRMKTWMRPGYLVVSNAILPIAEGYVEGIPVDPKVVLDYKRDSMTRQVEILKTLKIEGSVIKSPTQLGRLLFNEWNLEPAGLTPKGAPSTSAENMLRIHQASNDPRLDLVMEYKHIATMMSKYIDGFARSFEYLQSNTIHAAPNLLSTITGRMTYSSKFGKTKNFQTSIALHQLPRKEKSIKRAMVAPKGYKVLYMDASAQESRIMAIVANEGTMIEAFVDGLDLHSILTEELFGTPYADIVQANIDEKPIELVEQRQAGKLTGLSSFYRIGAKALAGKFFSTYHYDISIRTAQSYLTGFKRRYPGVVKYWVTAIGLSKSHGYARAFGGWCYRITKHDWKGESSAINHPIQGGGGILTYATIAVVSKKYQDVILAAQVHDSLTYFIPEDNYEAMGHDIIKYASEYDYGKLLQYDDRGVPIKWEGGVGDNFADISAITVEKEYKLC